MHTEDYQYLYDLEEHFWWFEGMREITANLLDPVCPPGPKRAVLDAGAAQAVISNGSGATPATDRYGESI